MPSGSLGNLGPEHVRILLASLPDCKALETIQYDLLPFPERRRAQCACLLM